MKDLTTEQLESLPPMFAIALEELTKREEQRLGSVKALWPAPYNIDCPEAAYKFLVDCTWTWNEANREADRIPEKEYIQFIVEQWWDTRRRGQPIIFHKSRRLIVSWLMRGLDVWDAGLKPASIQMGARAYEGDGGSKAFVWRCWYIYDQLRERRPDWKLRKCLQYGNPQSYELDAIILPNGSKITAINSKAESFRGSGATRAVCEELSQYDHVATTWGQAITVCMGRPGHPGGHPVAICNASPNEEYLEIKKKPEANQ